MLKFIQCDQLRSKRIEFHAGLNTVLGDDAAHNSIGKSSLLLMIDFVFGGNTYADSKDITGNLGHHRIEWCMEYDSKQYFFARSTNSKDVVIQCNAEFEMVDTISTTSYCVFLAQMQNCQFDDLSYRGFIGSFSRVWGRDNADVTYPLKQKSSPHKADILKLVCMFEKYGQIKQQKEQADRNTEKKNALTSAAKHNLIPDIGAKDYKDNLAALSDMEVEIGELKASITGHQQDAIVLVSPEYTECKNTRAQLLLLRSSLQEQLKRTKINQVGNRSARVQLDRLVHYFPQLDIARLAEVDSFHQSLCKVLKTEIAGAIKELEKQIAEVEAEIQQVSTRMDSLIKCDDSTQYVVDRLTTLVSNKQHIEECNAYYLKKKELQDLIKRDSELMAELWAIVLQEISQAVNNELQAVIDVLYDTKRFAPLLALEQKSYKLIGREDTGTGTAYVNLIAFDIAIAKLTKLPILIHDSMLFKNVETPALESIFAQYCTLPQQIFIAIDEVSKFSEPIQTLLRSALAAQLTKTETLYIKDWKTK